MIRCTSCGLQLSAGEALCPSHHSLYGDDWASANRIMCNFFHRGIVPPRLQESDGEDHLWAQAMGL